MRGTIFVFGLAWVLAACGGGGGGAEPVSAAAKQTAVAAPAETAALTFLLVPGGAPTPTGAASSEALRSALVSAGYKVVIDRRAPHDVEIVSRVAATEEQSMFAVQVNGKRDIKERVHLTGSVVSKGQVLDEISADFVTTNSQVSPNDVAAAVKALSSSQRVAQFGKDVRAQADAREHAKQEKEEQAKKRTEDEAKKKQRVEEESDWNRARVTGCRQPTSLTGCDAVRTYLAKYPEGAHLEEAQAALKASEPLMEKLQKDENAWKTAGVDGCRTDRTRDACTGVELYVTKFPAGMHLDEAQSLIRGLQ